MDCVAISPCHFVQRIAHFTAVQLYSFDNLWEGSTVEQKLHLKFIRFGLVELRKVTTDFAFRAEGGPIFI